MAGCKRLSMKRMLESLEPVFQNAKEKPRRHASMTYPLADVIKAALAVFVFKKPSLLAFERDINADRLLRSNVKRLFDLRKTSCDETMRPRLDEVVGDPLRAAFKVLFACAQRAKLLRHFRNERWPDHCVLAIDGTGLHLSKLLRCKRCCDKTYRSGEEEFYHHMVVGALPSGTRPEVLIPSALEFVHKADGERGRQRDRRIDYARRVRLTRKEDAPRVNMVATRETVPRRGRKGEATVSEWAFVTDLELPRGVGPRACRPHAQAISDIGRSRWNIENHLFKTLKDSTGWNMQHNYGHGKKELQHVLTTLMMIAFAMDQLQFLGSAEFQQAYRKCHEIKRDLWQAQLRKLSEFKLAS